MLFEEFPAVMLIIDTDSTEIVGAYESAILFYGYCRPPESRTNLLTLHGLAMSVVNNGSRSQAPEMFELAMDLDEQISQMMINLEQVQDTIAKLVSLYPESLANDEEAA
jgi:hypothetical protein